MKIFIVLLLILANNQLEPVQYKKVSSMSGCWLAARQYNVYEREDVKTITRCMVSVDAQGGKQRKIVVLPDYDNFYWTPRWAYQAFPNRHPYLDWEKTQ